MARCSAAFSDWHLELKVLDREQSMCAATGRLLDRKISCVKIQSTLQNFQNEMNKFLT